MLVVVAEAPAGVEDQWCRVDQRPAGAFCESKDHQVGQPLVGPSGVLLKQVLQEVGVEPSDVWYTNVCRCGNQSSGNPTSLEIKKCIPYLWDELSTLDWSRCKGVMLLGQSAIRGVLRNGRLTVRETRHRVLDSFGPDAVPATLENVPLDGATGALEGSRIDDLGPGNGKTPGPTESRVLDPYVGSGCGNKLMQAPLRATFHPSAALPHHDPSLYQEIVQDFKDLLKKQRDTVKPVRIVTTIEELRQIFDGSDTIGVDAEWSSDGQIRMFGISDGKTNVVCLDPSAVMEWMNGR